jgi:hypothetical protein
MIKMLGLSMVKHWYGLVVQMHYRDCFMYGGCKMGAYIH